MNWKFNVLKRGAVGIFGVFEFLQQRLDYNQLSSLKVRSCGFQLLSWQVIVNSFQISWCRSISLVLNFSLFFFRWNQLRLLCDHNRKIGLGLYKINFISVIWSWKKLESKGWDLFILLPILTVNEKFDWQSWHASRLQKLIPPHSPWLKFWVSLCFSKVICWAFHLGVGGYSRDDLIW